MAKKKKLTQEQWRHARPGNQNLTPFKPGQSGNPGGRPKGESIVKILRRFMEEPGTFLVEKPDPEKMTTGELFAHQLLQQAVKGRTAYGREIIRQLCGNPPIRIIHKQSDDAGEPCEMSDEVARAMTIAAANLKVPLESEEPGCTP